MKLTLVLITGRNAPDENCEDWGTTEEWKATEHRVGAKAYRATRGAFVGNRVEGKFLWVRPANCRKHQQVKWIRCLNPRMTVASGGYSSEFVFEVNCNPPIRFENCLGGEDLLGIFIRHWIENREIRGLDWRLEVNEDFIVAEKYWGERGGRYVVNASPLIFLAGLRANEDERIVSDQGLKLWPVVQLLGDAYSVQHRGVRRGPLLGWQPGRIQNMMGERETHYNKTIDSSGEVEAYGPQGRQQILWIYSYLETELAERVGREWGGCSSDLAVVNAAKVRGWREEERSAGIAIGTNNVVRRGDVVLAHGFTTPDLPGLKAALDRLGVAAVDYSSEDPAWEECILQRVDAFRTAADVYSALSEYVARWRKSRPSQVVRRIIHRAVNRLAPLRIDLGVLGELAREGDREGVTEHLAEMWRAWRARPEHHPLFSLGCLHAMLVGKVAEVSEVFPRESVPSVEFRRDECLVGCLEGRGAGEGVDSLVEDLIAHSGLQKVSGQHIAVSDSAPVSYLADVVKAVRRAYEEVAENSFDLAGELIEKALTADEGDVLAAWAGHHDFSYSAWLEELCALLEAVYEELEAVQE